MSPLDFGFAAQATPPSQGAPIPAPPSTVAGQPNDPAGKYVLAAKQYENLELTPSKAADNDSVLTLIVYGTKDSGKSCAPAGIKTRMGGRKVIISCDNTTEEALRNYYGAEFFDSCELYEPARRRVKKESNPDGTIKRDANNKPMITEIYPGFDPDRVWTADLVIAKISKIMAKLEQEQDVEVFILDHFQFLYEKIAATYARYKANRAPNQRMQLEDWQYRTESMDYIEAKARSIPMPGGIAVITGYGPQEKTTYGDEIVKPDGSKKRPVVTEVVTPKWLNPNMVRNWHCVLDMSYVDEKENIVGAQLGKSRYFVDIVSSKTPRFPKGMKAEITGKNLEMFWSERHLLPKEVLQTHVA